MKKIDKQKISPATENELDFKVFLSGIFAFSRYATRIFLDIIILSLIAGIGIGVYFYLKNPLDKKILSHQSAQTSIIYDRTGEHVLYEIHGEENRKIISHGEIPDNIRIATIAAEDNSFYSHSGVDFKGIIRALSSDVKSSQIQEGGSTITQQLARNVFLTREKTIQRKISEIFLSFKIEYNYSKDEILDMYLNEVPYGSNAYGIESASQIFFGKKAGDLTLEEAALLAALPNATTYYSPYGNHKDELIKRQQKILDKITSLNLSSVLETEKAKKTDVLSNIMPFKQNIEAPHFVFYVKEQLEKTYGQDIIERGGFRVFTTLDWEKQKLAENIVQKYAAEIQKKYNATNAALTAVDPKTGEILAMVGSRDYFDKSIDGQVNVTTSPRQPGSSFKPFAYATAFEKGYQPENLIYDVPTNFGPDGSGHDYKPHNYDGNFHGLVSLRQSLASSLNIPAVKTLYLAGISNTVDLARRMGISTLENKNRFGLALVLGGGEVTLLDETSAFGVFANDGRRNEATGIMKILDSQDGVFFENSPKNIQVLSEQVSRKINSILSDNQARSMVFGTGSKLYIPGRTVAAKTGTTQDFHDAWIVGYTPAVVTGVWVGNNNNEAMSSGADGSYVAAPIWNEFMSEILKDYPDEFFPDYEKGDSQKLARSGAPKITYFNTKSGKEISAEKAKKTDPDKLEIKMDYQVFSSDSLPLVVEMQNTKDPMILKWRESLNDPKILESISNNSPEKNSKKN